MIPKCPHAYTEREENYHLDMCRLHPEKLYGVEESDCEWCLYCPDKEWQEWKHSLHPSPEPTAVRPIYGSIERYEVDAKNASVLCGKLSQMANGAVYSEGGKTVAIHDRKLDALEDLIEAAGGNPLLVAYWFQHDLWRMKERFPELRVLKSPEDIRDWNVGKIPVAAIHPASCGHGLNLQAGGSTLVWFGLTWSLELYQQTNARLWRQGQKAETVVIHHLVTAGTIDERILQALKGKDQSQERLIDAVKAQFERSGAA